MADWVGVAADWFRPIYLRMREGLIKGQFLQADETPIRCQDPDEPSGKTFLGWLWAISCPDGDVVFDWRLSRRHEEAESLLAGFSGVLQADGYQAYARFAEDNKDVVRVGYFAHARRGFHEALDTEPGGGELYAAPCSGNLYHMENEWNERQVGTAERAHLRKRDFELTLRLIKKAAVLLAQRSRPRSPLGEACKYLLNQWDTLVAHCDHGITRLDNNLMENAIRGTAIGKNYAKCSVMPSTIAPGTIRPNSTWHNYTASRRSEVGKVAVVAGGLRHRRLQGFMDLGLHVVIGFDGVGCGDRTLGSEPKCEHLVCDARLMEVKRSAVSESMRRDSRAARRRT